MGLRGTPLEALLGRRWGLVDRLETILGVWERSVGDLESSWTVLGAVLGLFGIVLGPLKFGSCRKLEGPTTELGALGGTSGRFYQAQANPARQFDRVVSHGPHRQAGAAGCKKGLALCCWPPRSDCLNGYVGWVDWRKLAGRLAGWRLSMLVGCLDGRSVG